MMHLQKLTSNDSEFKRVLFSLFIGCVAKLFTVVTFTLLYLFMWASSRFSEVLKFPSESTLFSVVNGHYIWAYETKQLIVTLIFAPIFENIKIPIIFMIFKYVNSTLILPVVAITILEYYLHGQGIYGFTGASGFCIFGIYYAYLIKSVTAFKAYYYSVLAHFSTNVLALIASVF